VASACAWSVALVGFEGRIVEVEADIGAGLPRTVFVRARNRTWSGHPLAAADDAGASRTPLASSTRRRSTNATPPSHTTRAWRSGRHWQCRCGCPRPATTRTAWASHRSLRTCEADQPPRRRLAPLWSQVPAAYLRLSRHPRRAEHAWSRHPCVVRPRGLCRLTRSGTVREPTTTVWRNRADLSHRMVESGELVR
jgi:hypothetical protein